MKNMTLNTKYIEEREYCGQEGNVKYTGVHLLIELWTEYFLNSLLRVNGTYETAITTYNPSGKIISSHTEAGVNLISAEFIPLMFKLTNFGTYTLEIENLRSEEFNATLVPNGFYIDYEKPLFNYGIAAIIVLVLYPIIFFLAWNWSKVKRKLNLSR